MTDAEHKERHKQLHQALDELVADWVVCDPGPPTRLISTGTIMELMQWSYNQTVDPELPPGFSKEEPL